VANIDNLASAEPYFGWGDGSGMWWNDGYPIAKNFLGNEFPLASGPFRSFLTAAQAVWQSQGFVPTIDCGFKRDAYDNFSYDCTLETFIPTNWWDLTVWDHWYVDPIAGADSNSGTKLSPFRSLNKALTVAATVAQTGRVVWVQDGAVFKYGTAGTTGCWNGTAPVGNVVILPYSGVAGTTRWSTSMELENILTPWAQDLTNDPTGKTYKQVYNYSPGAIYVDDYSRIDYQGLPYALEVLATGVDAPATAAAVAAAPNSCASFGTTVWVNMQNVAGLPIAPSAPTGTSPGTFVGRASTNVIRVHDNSTFVMARCDVLGGSKPFGTQTSSNTAQTALTAFVDCTFKHSGRRIAAGADQNNFLYEEQADLYLLRCTSFGGGKDGFNYKYARAIEIDCESSWNGGYSTAKGDYFTSTAYGSNQGSTIHDDTRIIRFMGRYHDNNQNIYDASSANNACSLNVACYTYNSTGLDSVSKYNGDYGAETNGTLTIMIIVSPRYYDPVTKVPSTSTYEFIKGTGAVDAYYELAAPATADIRGTFSGSSHLLTY